MKRIVTHLSLLAAMAILATGCTPVRHNLPPDQRLAEPGPGVGGPGPGVLGPPPYAGMMGGVGMGPVAAALQPMPMGQGAVAMGPNATAAAETAVMQVGFTRCQPGCPGCHNCPGSRSGIPAGGGVAPVGPLMPAPSTVQVTFGRPDGMQVRYDQTGGGMFDSEPLIVPARQNFPQGGLYRVKLTNIPGREGVELYPTIELAYGNPRTGAYLAHNSVPVQFTEEDFDQVATGNFVTKVIYLPDPDFQGPALAGIDTLVSTRLDPGIDPIVEADRRGSILAIIRLGDKDIEMPGTSGLAGPVAMGPPVAGLPAPFAPAMTEGCGGPNCGPGTACGPCGGGCGNEDCVSYPPQLPGMVAGVTAPQYGMPMSGTPIGLPGPPHIPLGTPAGLTKHVMRNRTPIRLPRPVNDMHINVRHQPGYSYPTPVSRVNITEQNLHPGVPAGRGIYFHTSENVDPNCKP